MKARLNVKVLGAAVVLAVLLLGNLSFAQDNSKAYEKRSIVNLTNNIKNGNEGVKNNSIYFAGKYRIAELEDVLIDQLDVEKNDHTKLLIVLALNELGSFDGLNAIKDLSNTEKNNSLRNICFSIALDRGLVTK